MKVGDHMSVPDELPALRERLLQWLLAEALPTWWEIGADRTAGGFHEAIDLSGRPVLGERRARVQARQIFSYAVGGGLGWSGPWQRAVGHGLDYYLGRYRRADGLFWNALSSDGRPVEKAPHLYEQAFALLALATAAGATGANTTGANADGGNTTSANTAGANTADANADGGSTTSANAAGASTADANADGGSTTSASTADANADGGSTTSANAAGASTADANADGGNTTSASTAGANTARATIALDRALEPVAVTIAERLLAERRNPAGGFTGFVDDAVYQSDPHMHLLEAAMAWEAVSADPRWRALADEVAELGMRRFVVPGGGYLLEYFNADWSPAAGLAGRLVWPGHQFEWAGLLERWGRARGRDDARRMARRLYRTGADHGIDAVRGVAVFELLDDMTVHDPKARLWSQTEWLKAALILANAEEDAGLRRRYRGDAASAARALLRFLDTPLPGLWRDKLAGDGTWVEEPAPGSSFYHIVDALRVLAGTRTGA